MNPQRADVDPDRGEGGFRGEPLRAVEIPAALLGAVMLAAWAMLSSHWRLMQVGPIPYGNDGGCDAWFYYGLIHDPGAGRFLALDFGAPEVKRTAGRVMYFGPLYLLKLVLPGVGPNVLSYFTYLPATLVLLYVGLRALFAASTVALCCLLIGASSFVLSIASWTYVSNACLAYTAGMLCCLCWAARLRSAGGWAAPALYVSAGVFWAFSLNANFISIEFNVLLFLLALLGQGRRPFQAGPIVRDTLSAAGYCFLGFIAGIALFTAFAVALGLSVGTVFQQVLDGINGLGDWHYKGWSDRSLAFGLMFFVALLGIAAIAEGAGRQAAKSSDLFVGVSAVGATCLLSLFTTLILGDLSLVFDFHYLTLLPGVALILCFAFDAALRALSPSTRWRLFAGSFVAIVAANLCAANFVINKFWLTENTQLVTRLANGALAVALGLYLLRHRVARGARSFAPAMTGVSVLCAALVLQAASGDYSRNSFFDKVEDVRPLYDMQDKALAFLYARLDEAPVVWMAQEDPRQVTEPIKRGLGQCPSEASFPDRLPDPVKNQQPALAVGRTVVVLDTLARDARQIDSALAGHGFKLNVSAERSFPIDPDRQLKVTVGKVEAPRR